MSGRDEGEGEDAFMALSHHHCCCVCEDKGGRTREGGRGRCHLGYTRGVRAGREGQG